MESIDISSLRQQLVGSEASLQIPVRSHDPRLTLKLIASSSLHVALSLVHIVWGTSNFYRKQSLSNGLRPLESITTNGQSFRQYSSSAHATSLQVVDVRKDVIYPCNSVSQPELASTIPDSQARPPNLQNVSENTGWHESTGARFKRMSQKSQKSQSSHTSTIALSQTTFNNQGARSRRIEEAENTHITDEEGHAGDVDLLSSLQLGTAPEVDEDLDEDMTESSPQQTQVRLSQFPESQRFEPPSTRGTKRDIRGNELISPRLPRNPLARKSSSAEPAQVLGLSQVFQATQAVTSPCVNAITTEVHSDRPSPYVAIQSRPHTSGPSFSPLLRREADRQNPSTPFINYTTLEESQARRRSEEPQIEIEENDASDGDFDEPPSNVQLHDLEMRRREQRRRMFNATPSPPRHGNDPPLGSSPPTKQTTTSSPSTHKAGLNARQNAINLISDDDNDEEDARTLQLKNGGGAETDREDNAVSLVQQAALKTLHHGEDKENFDIDAVQVPDTTKRQHNVTNETLSVISPSLGKTEWVRDQCIPASSLPNRLLGLASSQHIDVADSQPSPTTRKEPMSNDHTLHSSNPETTVNVPQSQLPPTGTHVSASPTRFESSQRDKISTNAHPETAISNEQKAVVEAPKSSSMRYKGNTADEAGIARIVDSKIEKEQPSLAMTPNHSVTTRRQPLEKGPSISCRQLRSSAPLLGRKQINHIPDAGSSDHHYLFAKEPSAGGDLSYIVRKGSGATSQTENMPQQRETNSYETANTHFPQSLALSAPVPILSRISSMYESPNGGRRKRMSAIASKKSPEKSVDSNDFTVQDFLPDDEEFEEVLKGSSPIAPGRYRRGQLLKKAEKVSETKMGEMSSANDSDKSGVARQESPSYKHYNPDAIFEIDPESPPSVRPQRSAKRSLSNTTPSAKSLSRPKKRLVEKMRATQVSSSSDGPEKLIPSEGEIANVKLANADGIASPVNVQHPSDCDNVKQDVIAPNQVFARYFRGYYPARCLGEVPERTHYKIQWEGYEPDEIDVHGVRRLELRVGDQVKIDVDGLPKVSHVVRGFKQNIRAEINQSDSPITDIFGNKTLIVAPKQRKSLPVDISTEQCKEIAVSNIYLDNNMWNQMKDRGFEFKPSPVLQNLMTPQERPSTPNTPISRSRKTYSHMGPTSFANEVGLFANMAFAVSYEDESRKRSIMDTITQNGGRILESGFQDLFEAPVAVPTSPSGRVQSRTSDDLKLTFRATTSQLKFAGLIADRHSRKPKYMQALALNVPCLSGTWLENCAEKEKVLDWSPYLLPSGDSKALDGATKSRILTPYDPLTSSVPTVLTERPKLLEGHHVTFVKPKGKSNGRKEGKHNEFVFLIQAMGASNISRVNDLTTAKSLFVDADVAEGHCWIVMDENWEKSFKSGVRNSNVSSQEEGARARVVDFEFFIQSLIHGSL